MKKTAMRTLPIFISVPGSTYCYIIPDRPEIRVWAVVDAQVEKKADGNYENVPRRIAFYTTATVNFNQPDKYSFLKEVYLWDEDFRGNKPNWNDRDEVEARILRELFPALESPTTTRYFMKTDYHYRNGQKIYATSAKPKAAKKLLMAALGVARIDEVSDYEKGYCEFSLWEDWGYDNGKKQYMGCGGLIEINQQTAEYLVTTFGAEIVSMNEKGEEEA